MESKKIVFTYKDITFECNPPQKIEDFIDICKTKLNISNEELLMFTLIYKDDEGDNVEISSQYDYDQALLFLKSAKSNNQLQFTFAPILSQSIATNLSREASIDPLRSAAVFDYGLGYNNVTIKADYNTRAQKENEKEYQCFNGLLAKNLKETSKMQQEEDEKVKLIEIEKKKIEEEKAKIINENKAFIKEKGIIAVIKQLVALFKHIRATIFTDLKQRIETLPLDPNKSLSQEELEQKRRERRTKIMEFLKQNLQEKSMQESQLENEKIYQSQLQSIQQTFQKQLEEKIETLLNKEITEIKKGIIANSLSIQQELMQDYATHVSQIGNLRHNPTGTEVSQLYSSINNSDINSIHEDIECDLCKMCPIVGVRYKCTHCKIYDLCERCEEVNYKIKAHNYYFMRVREPLKSQEKKYSFSIIKNETIQFKRSINKNGQFMHHLILLNDGLVHWDKMILQCNKAASVIQCADVITLNVKPNLQTFAKVTLIIPEELPDGDYTCTLNLIINGILMEKNIKINVVIYGKDLSKKVEEFRKQFNLTNQNISDTAIINALEGNLFNFELAFESLFS